MATVRRYIITGRVQGVGYRRFVEREAVNLGITGWVRNLAHGEVEALALAERPVLSDFEERLRKGPMFAKVREIQSEDLLDYTKLPDAFLILQ